MGAKDPRKMNSFQLRFQQSCSQHPQFGEIVLRSLKERGILNADVFSYKTKLNKSLYYDLRGRPDRPRNMKTVVALCISIGADLDRAEYLLKLSGLAFNPRNISHQAYREVIINSLGKSRVEINAFLESNQVESLPYE